MSAHKKRVTFAKYNELTFYDPSPKKSSSKHVSASHEIKKKIREFLTIMSVNAQASAIDLAHGHPYLMEHGKRALLLHIVTGVFAQEMLRNLQHKAIELTGIIGKTIHPSLLSRMKYTVISQCVDRSLEENTLTNTGDKDPKLRGIYIKYGDHTTSSRHTPLSSQRTMARILRHVASCVVDLMEADIIEYCRQPTS